MRLKHFKTLSTAALSFLLVFLISKGSLLAEKNKIRIISQNAILYLKPNKDSIQIMKLPLGSVYDVLGYTEEWVQIQTPPDKNGIIIKGFLLQIHTETFSQAETLPLPRPKPETEATPPVFPEGAIETGGLKIGAGISTGYTTLTLSPYQGGFDLGGSFIVILLDYFGLELSASYCQHVTQEDIEGLSDGRLSAIQVGLNLIGRIPISRSFIPHISVGGFYSFNRFTLDANLISAWDDLGFDIDETVANAAGLIAGAGFDLKVAAGFFLGIKFNYRLMTSEGTWSFKDQVSRSEETGTFKDLSLNSFSIDLALKYIF
jgi:hypothetical protein